VLESAVGDLASILHYVYVFTGGVVLLLCVGYVLTTFRQLRSRGMWPCPRCGELGGFLGACGQCGLRFPGLRVFGRWFGVFFGPVLVVGALLVFLCLAGSLRMAFVWSFLLGVPFAALLFIAYSLVFGRRSWLCPQCKEPGPFFGRCKVCGQKAPGLMHCLGYLGIAFGVVMIIVWAWLVSELISPSGGGGIGEERTKPATSQTVESSAEPSPGR